MKSILIIRFTFLCSVASFRYDGFSLIGISPQIGDHINAIKEFSKEFIDDEINFQFERPTYNNGNTTINVIVSPMVRQKLEQFLSHRSLRYSVIIDDYQRLIRREREDNRRSLLRSYLRGGPSGDHIAYRRYGDIERWLKKKIKGVPHANFIKFGETVEKRKLFLIKISKNDSLPIVWLDGGIHAREWISVSSLLFVIDMLLQNSSLATEMLASFQFMICPLVNPDGYEYSHQVFRLWRKNRSYSNTSACCGVDLNRNYPYDWSGQSSSTHPCSDQYRGHDAGSEKEIQAIIGQMTNVKNRIGLLISVHSYGQLILQPYHYSADHYPRHYLLMTSIAMRASYNVQNKHGIEYRVGRGPDILYSVSGSSNDFAVGTLGIPLSFTIELPDQGNRGFILPPHFIRPVGQQLWDILYSLTADLSKMSFY